MIEYETQKKERYFFEVIRLYIELGYSIGHISRIFPLSYGTVKRWLSIFAEEERKDNESAMKKKSSTPQNHMDTNEEIKALKAQIARSERNFNNARIKAELYNEMINVAEQHFGSISCSIKALMEIPSVLPLPWDDRTNYRDKIKKSTGFRFNLKNSQPFLG